MAIVCWIIGLILCILSIIGSIVPGIPWPQLAYVGIILSQITMNQPYPWLSIIIRWFIMVALIFIDYYLPILGTKKFWWSKRWNRWCIIWMILWLFLGILWIIFWPFLWALIWEYLQKKNRHKSIKPAFWAFIGFLWWTLLKLVISIILSISFCSNVFQYYFKNNLDSPAIQYDTQKM